jgi:hypothetical protein
MRREREGHEALIMAVRRCVTPVAVMRKDVDS